MYKFLYVLYINSIYCITIRFVIFLGIVIILMAKFRVHSIERIRNVLNVADGGCSNTGIL